MVKRVDGPPSRVPPSVQRKLSARKTSRAKSVVAPKVPTPKRTEAPSPKRHIKQELMAAPDDLVPEEMQAIFGENLKAARLKCGLKQSEVAEQAGLTQQRLSKIENGRLNLTLRTMVRLANVVDHNVSAMLAKVKSVRSKK